MNVTAALINGFASIFLMSSPCWIVLSIPDRGEQRRNERGIDLDRMRDDQKAVLDEAHRNDQDAAAHAVESEVF